MTLLDAGHGRAADYNNLGSDINSAAVLATCKSPTASISERASMCLEARNHKASCLLYNTPEKDDNVVSAHVSNINFPALSISNRAAADLRSLLAEHGEVKINFESNLESADSTTYNVVGNIVGSKYPNEVIYITAHHDSWFYGANDNMSSVACLLETAKIFNKYRPRRTIRFVIFGSEESGGKAEESAQFGECGSAGYCKAHYEALTGQLDEIPICIINGEFMGYSQLMDAMCSPELIPGAREVASDLGEYARAVEPTPYWYLSDQVQFHLRGVSSIMFWMTPDLGTGRRSPFFAFYHSDGDNMDMIKAKALKKNAELMALMAMRFDSVDFPYSLETLRDAAVRGTGCLMNSDRIRQVYDEKVKQCLEEESREEKLRQILSLVRAVNMKIYTFVERGFVNKFEVINDAIEKLRDAANIVEVEGSIGRARDVLVTIENAARYLEWSREVTDQADRRAQVFLDLRGIFTAIDQQESAELVLKKIRVKLKEARQLAQNWSEGFEEALAK
ncbi:MAG: M20/M25/M40 family metallo-hydrolase [Deltaproteobacteria bacterium]|nr:M20/M25/M40 family metallo-hydrolase [Deltaproteobacteria bacterium]